MAVLVRPQQCTLVQAITARLLYIALALPKHQLKIPLRIGSAGTLGLLLQCAFADSRTPPLPSCIHCCMLSSNPALPQAL